MARDIQKGRTRSSVHLPKRVSRQGTNQRDWIVSRINAARRLTLMISFAAGAAFTGLALRHTLKPMTVQAQDIQPISQQQTASNQSINVPSQSLFENQTSTNFSVAPAPQTPQYRVRTSSS